MNPFKRHLLLWCGVVLICVTTPAPLVAQQAQPPAASQPKTEKPPAESSRPAPSVHTPDDPDMVRETQQTIQKEGSLALVWWIPYDYWVAAAGGRQSLDFGSLKDYTMIAALVARIGPLGSLKYVPGDELQKKLVMRDAQGNEYGQAENVAEDAKQLARVIKPILANSLGQLGENLQIMFYPGKTKNGVAISDPKQKGELSFVLRELIEPETVFQWKLPLTAYTEPKYCPVGKERVHANWDYCPWHGVPLGAVKPTPQAH